MSSSKILFYISIFFVAGILLESIVIIPRIFLWGFLVLAIVAIVVSLFVKNDIFIVIGFCIFFFTIGVLRMQVSEFSIANDKLSKLNNTGEITLTGIISAEPDVMESYQKLKVKINESTVLVSTNRYPEYDYLDKIKITGKLEEPPEYDDFSYKNYLMKDGIYSVANFPVVELIKYEHHYNVFSYLYEKILFLKQKLRESLRNNFSPPESYILEGTILGDKKSIPQDFKNKMSVTGLSHIIAVSGMHIVILSSIVMFFLLAIGLWRSQAFYFAIIFIFIYVILTGLPASGVRAAIMGTIYLLGQKLGRQSVSSRTIVLAASAILLFNPLLLFYDVGFQLSFLAILGIIFFDPFVRKFFKFLIKKFLIIDLKEKYENWLSLLSVTISAQIFTLPIIVFNFGIMSLIAPITNILVLPVVYYVMLFGFLSSVLGIFSNLLGWILSIPCHILLSYFLWVIDLFSEPWMSWTIKNMSWIWLLNFYLIIISVTVFIKRKYARDL